MTSAADTKITIRALAVSGIFIDTGLDVVDRVVVAASKWHEIRAFALQYPHAIEDLPWDTPVIKVDHPPGRKINGFVYGPMFLWLGRSDVPDPAVAVRLTSGYDEAVAMARATPMKYSGLGHWGWLTIPLASVNPDLLYDWIDESYRNVAPKALIKQIGSI